MELRSTAAVLLLGFTLTLAMEARADEMPAAATLDPASTSLVLSKHSWGTFGIATGLIGGMFLSTGIIALDCSTREFCKPNPTAGLLFHGGGATTNILTWAIADQANVFARRASGVKRPGKVRTLGNILQVLGTVSSLILYPLAYIWQPFHNSAATEASMAATFVAGLTFSYAGTFVLLGDARTIRSGH